MYYNQINSSASTYDVTNEFRGLNRNKIIGDGEFTELNNISDDNYPIMQTRAPRGVPESKYLTGDNEYIVGIYKSDENFYEAIVDKSSGQKLKLWINGTEKITLGNTTYDENIERQILPLGAYVLVMPDRLYINTAEYRYDSDEEKIYTDKGSTDVTNVVMTGVKLFPCNIDGKKYSIDYVGDKSPTDPTDSMVWLDISKNPYVLKRYVKVNSMWTSVSDGYILVTGHSIAVGLKADDGIQLTGLLGHTYKDLNGTRNVIKKLDNNNIVINGYMNEIYVEDLIKPNNEQHKILLPPDERSLVPLSTGTQIVVSWQDETTQPSALIGKQILIKDKLFSIGSNTGYTNSYTSLVKDTSFDTEGLFPYLEYQDSYCDKEDVLVVHISDSDTPYLPDDLEGKKIMLDTPDGKMYRTIVGTKIVTHAGAWGTPSYWHSIVVNKEVSTSEYSEDGTIAKGFKIYPMKTQSNNGGNVILSLTRGLDPNDKNLIKADDNVMFLPAEDYIVASGTIIAERKIPDLDFYCISNNRIWGCRYGSTFNYAAEPLSSDAYCLNIVEVEESGNQILVNGTADTSALVNKKVCIGSNKKVFTIINIVDGNNLEIWLDDTIDFEVAAGTPLLPINAPELTNEIFACKLGDFKNWYSFSGIASDSYFVSLGSTGEFTGAFNYLGYPTFFKENHIYTVYGSYPAQYQLNDTIARGVEKGSHKSLAMVNEVLYYKGVDGIMAYTGQTPNKISYNLGDEVKYKLAIGCGHKGKYYVEMYSDQINTIELLIYDTNYSIWLTEDPTLAETFVSNGDEIFLFNTTGDRLKCLYPSNEARELATEKNKIKWEAVTGLIGLGNVSHSYISRIITRVFVQLGAYIDIYISYDDGQWELKHKIFGEGRLDSHDFQMRLKRCDHFRLKFKGKGNCKIVSITKVIMQGSDRR